MNTNSNPRMLILARDLWPFTGSPDAALFETLSIGETKAMATKIKEAIGDSRAVRVLAQTRMDHPIHGDIIAEALGVRPERRPDIESRDIALTIDHRNALNLIQGMCDTEAVVIVSQEIFIQPFPRRLAEGFLGKPLVPPVDDHWYLRDKGWIISREDGGTVRKLSFRNEHED